MLAEVQEAKAWFKEKFGDNPVPAGQYAIPCETSKGDAFMRIILDDKTNMSGFDLFWDEAMTESWYANNKNG